MLSNFKDLPRDFAVNFNDRILIRYLLESSKSKSSKENASCLTSSSMGRIRFSPSYSPCVAQRKSSKQTVLGFPPKFLSEASRLIEKGVRRKPCDLFDFKNK